MSTLSLLVLFSFVIVTSSLKCYKAVNVNVLNLQNTQPEECGIGFYSCTKTIEYTTNLVTKTCSTTNCTQGTVTNAAAFCQNVSASNLLNTMSCCCYGDGCNSANDKGSWTVIVATLLAAASMMTIPTR